MNAFRPPKSSVRPYTPVNELKDVNYIKNEIKPSGGPLNVPAISQQTPKMNNPFSKLKAMFAQKK